MLGLASRQFEAALSSSGITKGGNRREHTADKEKEEEKESPQRMDPLVQRGRAGVGGRRTWHGRGAGLLQF